MKKIMKAGYLFALVIGCVMGFGFPAQAIEGIKDSIDCNLYFYGENVSVATMYAVLCTAILVFVAIYVALNIILGKKN